MVLNATSVIAITTENIDNVLEIQKKVYSRNICETKKVFEAILHFFPAGCRLLKNNNKFIGYVFFHPYEKNKVKPLNITLNLTGKEKCMYLHDLAIDPEYQKKGFPGCLIAYFEEITAKYGFEYQALVSVQNSRKFWERYGFMMVETVQDYGGEGCNGYYMKKLLKI